MASHSRDVTVVRTTERHMRSGRGAVPTSKEEHILGIASALI